MSDQFELHVPELDDPSDNAAAVTPNDSTDLTNASRAIYVGTAGDVRVDMVTSGTVTFTNMEAGWHPIRCKRVYATGTTAAGIVAVW